MANDKKSNPIETFTLKAKNKPEVDVSKMTKPENSKANSKEKNDDTRNN